MIKHIIIAVLLAVLGFLITKDNKIKYRYNKVPGQADFLLFGKWYEGHMVWYDCETGYRPSRWIENKLNNISVNFNYLKSIDTDDFDSIFILVK